jgi:hypothetical protein
MPAIATLSGVNDAETTPVAHSFVPRNIQGDIATFVEAGTTSLEDKKLTVGVSRTADKGRSKTTIRLAWPIVQTQTVNGVSSPTLVRTAYAEFTMSSDSASTVQERKNALTVLKNVLTNANVVSAATNPENFW